METCEGAQTCFRVLDSKYIFRFFKNVFNCIAGIWKQCFHEVGSGLVLLLG